MKYTFHEDTDLSAFDSFVMHSDQNSLHQCSNWAKVKKNWKAMFTSVTNEDGEIVATALVLIRHMIFNKTLFYIPRGPVMDYYNDELVSFMLMNLAELAHQNHAVAVRFDPNIKLRKYPYADRNKENPMEHYELIAMLENHGAEHKGLTTFISESTQPRFNAEMDVNSDWQKQLKRQTLKRMKTAPKLGVELYEGPEYIEDFTKAMHYTEVRKNIALRNAEYFKDMQNAFGDHAICIVAKLNFKKQIAVVTERIEALEEKYNQEGLGENKRKELMQQINKQKKELKQLEEDYKREGCEEVITSGALSCYNDGLMELFYMGNHPDYLRLYSSYYINGTFIKRCEELGIKECSFGGVEGTLDDGLTMYKSNWLMNVEEYIGEFNMVLDRPTYFAFEKVYPKVLEFAAKAKSKK